MDDISRFIVSICEKQYIPANVLLEKIVKEKVKNKIKKTAAKMKKSKKTKSGDKK